MHRDWNLDCWDAQHVNTYIEVAHCQFGNLKLDNCDQVGLGSFRQRWHPFWCPISVLDWWRCTCSFMLPAFLQILCCVILERQAAAHVDFLYHSRVSLYRSLHVSMPWKLNSPHCLVTDSAAWFVGQVLALLYCGAWKPSFGHFGHIPGKAHARLF